MTRNTNWLYFTFFTLFLSGCATAPMEPQSVASPRDGDEFFASKPLDSSESIKWADRFGDETLNQLIAEALDVNFGLDAAEAQARAAEAAERIAGSLRIPSLSLGFNSSRQKSRFSFLNFQKIETESHALNLKSQWEVDVWGRLRDTHASGLANFEAAEADVKALKLSIAAQVARSWFNMLEAQQQWQLAIDSSRSLEQKLTSLDRRYDRGLVTSLDLRLTRAQAASSRALIQQRKTQLNNTKRSLEVLLGRYPSATQNSSHSLPSLNNDIPEGLQAELVARRPDLYAAERRLAAMIAQQNEVSNNWLPRLALTGNSGTTSNELTDLLDSDFSVWSIAGDLAANLFAAGRLKSERVQSQAQAESQLAQYRSTVLTAFQEVENALSSEIDLSLLREESAISADENQKAEDLAWEQYDKGLVDITTLLDAQRRADESASKLISIQNQRLQNRINLHLALGGDFE